MVAAYDLARVLLFTSMFYTTPTNQPTNPTGGADGRPFVYTTTPRPPQLHYEVEVKLTGVGSNYNIPEPGTTSWIQLTDRVRDSVEGALKDVPGYEATEVTQV